jgi:hypothetical protein
MQNESFKALKYETVENSHGLAHQGLQQVAEGEVAAMSWIFPFELTCLTGSKLHYFSNFFCSKNNE